MYLVHDVRFVHNMQLSEIKLHEILGHEIKNDSADKQAP